MEKFEWKDKFSVHVVEMDGHHKKLFEYFIELQNEIHSGDATQKVGEILDALIEYSHFHFIEEERLMKAMNYPDLTAQIKQHQYFTAEVNEMKKQSQLGVLPSRSVLAFLRDWFINHIMQEDRKYGEMLKQGAALV